MFSRWPGGRGVATGDPWPGAMRCNRRGIEDDVRPWSRRPPVIGRWNLRRPAELCSRKPPRL